MRVDYFRLADRADISLSKMNTERGFLHYLHDLGLEAADRWLEANYDRIGWEGTLDVEQFADHDT